MTVIAFDGKTVAADKQSTNCGNPSKVTKIFHVPGGIVAFSGSGVHAVELLPWFKDSRNPETFPKSRSNDADDAAGAMFIDRARRIYLYTAYSPYPELIEMPIYARGSGRDYALAVLSLGYDAVKAVEVACNLDVFCGMGIDALSIDDIK